MEQELIKRTTLVEMVTTWNAAQENIKKAFDLLTETKERLTAVFGDYTFESRHLDSLDAERTIADCHRRAWKEIVQKTEMRRLLSIKRAKELDEHLDEDELPPITEEEIIKMLKSAVSNAGTFSEEMIVEVFHYLRPHESGYKTNAKIAAALGNKVILGWGVEQRFSSGFNVNYHRQDEIRAVDNVFHALDGKGFSKSYYGDLHDAIEKSPDGQGETEYFRFKCYHNHNLHLEFKRPDLVQRMNVIVKERSLRPNTA